MEVFKKFHIGQCNIVEHVMRWKILINSVEHMLMMYLYKNYLINILLGKSSIRLTRYALEWCIVNIIVSYLRSTGSTISGRKE